MKLCKKTNKIKGFWVEDYTEQEKEFFIGLGFTERRVKFMREWMSGSLLFTVVEVLVFGMMRKLKLSMMQLQKSLVNCKPRLLTTAELM